MEDKLIEVLQAEKEALKKLLEALEKQHKDLFAKDPLVLEKDHEAIKEACIDVASEEKRRRQLLGGVSIVDTVKELDNPGLTKLLAEVQGILDACNLEKEANNTLLKQNLLFTNKMLAFMKPNREIKTYGVSGKLRGGE